MIPRKYAKWTLEMEAALRAMWLAGVPVRNIAGVLVVSDPAVSRNSTISHAHKMGLPRHELSKGKWKQPRPSQQTSTGIAPRLPMLSIQSNRSLDGQAI